MKKVFATLCALILPVAQSYAWMGGPFSNNSLTPEGDDGVYEAIAIPQAGTVPTFNGIGLYRWAVQNQNSNGGTLRIAPLTGNASNVQFNGFLGATSEHVWYINGVTYYGLCFGSVNSMAGHVNCVGNARVSYPTTTTAGIIGIPGVTLPAAGTSIALANSFFTAGMRHFGRFVATRNFEGTGQVRVVLDAAAAPPGAAAAPLDQAFNTRVFGTRVSLRPQG